MTREEAINILIAVAVCSTEYLYCDEHCPFYHPEGVRVCNEWNDEMAKEAVETISALRQEETVTDSQQMTNADRIRAMNDEEFGDIATVKVTKTFADLYKTEDKHEAD